MCRPDPAVHVHVSISLHGPLPVRRRVAVATPSADSSWLLMPQQETQRETTGGETRWTAVWKSLPQCSLQQTGENSRIVTERQMDCKKDFSCCCFFNLLLSSCWKMLTPREFDFVSVCWPDGNLQSRVLKSWQSTPRQFFNINSRGRYDS